MMRNAICMVGGLAGLLWIGGAAEARGTVAGKVTVKHGSSAKGDRSGVVVYLENVSGAAGSRAGGPPRLKQRDLKFDPPVIAIVKGTTVEFPNEDKIFHNVFSLSQVAKFDLGLYKSGTTKTVTFDRPGAVEVYCNIHPEMVATIKVLDNGFFAVTDKSGAFHINDVPAGTYPVVGWISRGQEFRGSVTVKDGATATIDFDVVETAGSPRHQRKDGTPYGRYE
jgi:plastocyanin